jgi:hypothetical protein
VGPIVTSEAARSAELDISLLERLFERPLYTDHPQARSKMQNLPPLSEIFKFKPFSNLVKVCIKMRFNDDLSDIVCRIIEVIQQY